MKTTVETTSTTHEKSTEKTTATPITVKGIVNKEKNNNTHNKYFYKIYSLILFI